MTIDEKISVLQAAKAGKPIQRQNSVWADTTVWMDDECPSWDFLRSNYRVKPEPREPREWVLELKSFKEIRGPAGGIDEVVRVREVLP